MIKGYRRLPCTILTIFILGGGSHSKNLRKNGIITRQAFFLFSVPKIKWHRGLPYTVFHLYSWWRVAFKKPSKKRHHHPTCYSLYAKRSNVIVFATYSYHSPYFVPPPSCRSRSDSPTFHISSQLIFSLLHPSDEPIDHLKRANVLC